jgi:hypothetical protein
MGRNVTPKAKNANRDDDEMPGTPISREDLINMTLLRTAIMGLTVTREELAVFVDRLEADGYIARTDSMEVQ